MALEELEEIAELWRRLRDELLPVTTMQELFVATADRGLPPPPMQDPWGNAYHLALARGLPGRERMEVSCYGPDGDQGTPDDLRVTAQASARTR